MIHIHLNLIEKKGGEWEGPRRLGFKSLCDKILCLVPISWVVKEPVYETIIAYCFSKRWSSLEKIALMVEGKPNLSHPHRVPNEDLRLSVAAESTFLSRERSKVPSTRKRPC